MKSMDLGCGVGSGRNSADVFYVSATLNVGINFCKVDTFQNGILKQQQQKKTPKCRNSKPNQQLGLCSFARLLLCAYML